MTGNKSRKSKILRAVIFTASLLWAGNPVKTAAEENTETYEGGETLIEWQDRKQELDAWEKDDNVSHYKIIVSYRIEKYERKPFIDQYGNEFTPTYKYRYAIIIKSAIPTPAHITPGNTSTTNQYLNKYGIVYGGVRITGKSGENNEDVDLGMTVNRWAFSKYYNGDQVIANSMNSKFNFELNGRAGIGAYGVTDTKVIFTGMKGQNTADVYFSGIHNTGGNSGSSGTDEETAQNITSILNELKADPEKMEQITTTTTQNNEALEEIAQQEQEITDAANEEIEKIDPNGVFQNELFTSGKLGNALMWIREVHRQTIEATQIGNIVSVTLILGLAAYMIGRRGG